MLLFVKLVLQCLLLNNDHKLTICRLVAQPFGMLVMKKKTSIVLLARCMQKDSKVGCFLQLMTLMSIVLLSDTTNLPFVSLKLLYKILQWKKNTTYRTITQLEKFFVEIRQRKEKKFAWNYRYKLRVEYVLLICIAQFENCCCTWRKKQLFGLQNVHVTKTGYIKTNLKPFIWTQSARQVAVKSSKKNIVSAIHTNTMHLNHDEPFASPWPFCPTVQSSLKQLSKTSPRIAIRKNRR